MSYKNEIQTFTSGAFHLMLLFNIDRHDRSSPCRRKGSYLNCECQRVESNYACVWVSECPELQL